jgi:hypothetical protein
VCLEFRDASMSDLEARLPNFLVIGAMKAGTTSLWRYLRTHPEVFMPDVKEIDFFSRNDNWNRGLDWYLRHFQEAHAARAVGEASTGYTKHPLAPGVAERIAATLPDARLVYVVRDPIERIRSHYDHAVAAGVETQPLDVAVLDDPEYVDTSSYGIQLEQYLAHFPRDRLLVIDSSALRRSRSETMRTVFAFLGVDPHSTSVDHDREYYVTAVRRSPRPSVRQLTSSPVLRRIARRLPSRLKQRLARAPVLSKTASAEARGPVVSDETQRELRRRLQDDVALFRRLSGVTTYWPLFDKAD